MNKNLLIGLSVMTLVIIVGSYLNRGSKPVIVKPNNTSLTSNDQQLDSGEVQRIEIVAKDFSLTPSKVKVKKGDKVKIVFKNEGSFDHNFRINILNVVIDRVPVGGTEEITFSADRVGEFEFECTVSGHKDLGMQGSITVE